MADVFAVTSGKGGVGKTTTAVNVAVGLRQRGHTVALLDADLGMPNVSSVLLVDPEATIHDVLAGEADVDDALVEPAEGLGILAGDVELEGFAAADPRELEAVVEELASRYRFVVVDTGGGLSFEGVFPIELADEVVLVSTADPAAVTDTEKSRQLAERVGVPVAGVVASMVDAEDGPAVAERLGVDLLANVPYDDTVVETVEEGKPTVTHSPQSPAGMAYDALAAKLAGDADAALEPLVDPERAAGYQKPEGDGETESEDETESEAETDGDDETTDVAAGDSDGAGEVEDDGADDDDAGDGETEPSGDEDRREKVPASDGSGEVDDEERSDGDANDDNGGGGFFSRLLSPFR